MEVKDLQRQTMDAQRTAEWGQLLLQLNEQIQALQAENEELKKQLEGGGQNGNQTSPKSSTQG